jgi:hypothetical protein
MAVMAAVMAAVMTVVMEQPCKPSLSGGSARQVQPAVGANPSQPQAAPPRQRRLKQVQQDDIQYRGRLRGIGRAQAYRPLLPPGAVLVCMEPGRVIGP